MDFLNNEVRLSVNTSYLKPRIRVFAKIKYKPLFAPICLSSQLLIDSKIISEYSSNIDSSFDINQFTNINYETIDYKEFILNLYFSLDEQAIQAIERHRLNRQDKSVSFDLRLSVNSIFEAKEVKNIKLQTTIDKIEQSFWINNFASQLGIGDFLLLELNKPNKEKFLQAISTMPSDSSLKVFLETGLDQLYKKLEESKGFIQEGRWDKSIEALRPVIENFRGRDSDDIVIEMKQYYERSVETDNGWQEFRSLVQNLFDYSSKYIHTLGQGQNRTTQQIIPTAREEDAYFIYNLCLSILYWIKRKIER